MTHDGLTRRQLVAGSVALGATALMGGALAGCSGTVDYDLAYTNGKIYTGNEDALWAEAVGIKDGKFTYVGSASGLNAGKNVVDLQGKVMVPGFVDGHNHIYKSILQANFQITLSNDKTLEDYKKTITSYVKAHPDQEVYRGLGWLNSCPEFNGCPTAAQLDEIYADKPMYLTSQDGHSCWVNSKLMETYGIDKSFPDVAGGKVERDSEGNPVGCFRDKASNAVGGKLPDYSVDAYQECIKGSEMVAAYYGYTTYMNAMINEVFNENLYDAFKGLDEKGALLQRVRAAAILGNGTNADARLEAAKKMINEGTENLKNGGNFAVNCAKIFMDGVVEGATGFMKEPYCHRSDNWYGSDSWAGDENVELLNKLVKECNDEGIFCHFHAVGDAAIEKALCAIEKAQDGKGDVNDVRNSMTHLQIVDEDHFKRFADTGTGAVCNPWGIKAVGFYNETEVVYLGEERASKEYPLKSWLDAGVHVAAATDYPAGSPWSSFDALEVFVNRTYQGDVSTQLNPSQGVSVEQAVDIMTKGGAYELHLENECGMIKEGMSADLVVLDQDIFEVDPLKLHETKAALTVAMGKVIYDEKEAESILEAAGIAINLDSAGCDWSESA